MAATTKLVLRKDKKRKDGTCPVFVRITANRKSRYISSKVYVAPKYWNADRQEVRTSHDIAPALNKRLRTLVLDAQTKALDSDSADAVKSSVAGSSLLSM